MDIFDSLKQAAAPEWDSYVNHQFVRQLGDGTLSELAARSMTDRRFEELARLFAKASRLEADFWQMGLGV